MAANEFEDLVGIMDKELINMAEKRKLLRNLDMFVLDNSLRECSVGQLRGHTVEDKTRILEEVRKCGFTNIIVASFSHMPRVDDTFVQQLCENESDLSGFFSFSEVDINNPEDIPVALTKMKMYKLRNVIFEVDVAPAHAKNDSEFTSKMCEILKKRINWTFENLAENAKVFVNIRDFPFAMATVPKRVFTIVKCMADMPTVRHPFGIAFEEPTGNTLPEFNAGSTMSIRKCMNDNGWSSGKLIVHVHEKWGFSDATQLECLSSGADGVWAGVCSEGAAVGHASSTVSIMNLVRMGNTKVQKKFNCTYLREAAINVTKITTGDLPHPKQIIYGARALDMVLDFGGVAERDEGVCFFNIAKFFGVEAPKRMSTLASTDMIKDRLVNLYGEDEQFNDEIALNMKQLMITDLTNGRKEEYMSYVGIALLFDRAGGKLTVKMRDAIEKVEVKLEAHKRILEAVRVIWDEWDILEVESNDDCLEFSSFYNGFMSPYFGCYQCDTARKALKAIDMDADNKVNWSEFCVYLKWALNEYPQISTTDELLSTAFLEGIIPAMYDELLENIPA